MTNRRRVYAIIFIVSIIVSALIFARVMSEMIHSTEYTAYTDSMVTSEGVFFSENLKGEGLIYRFNTDGRVKNIFNTQSMDCEKVYRLGVYEGNLMAILSKQVEVVVEENGSAIKKLKEEYRIVTLANKLSVIKETSGFYLEEGEIVKDISSENGDIFITVITSDGSTIKIYSLNESELLDPKEIEKKENKKEKEKEEGSQKNAKKSEKESKGFVDTVRIKGSTEGRFYVDAKYADGELTYRTDADKPTGAFAEDARVTDVISKMKLSPLKGFVVYGRYFLVWIAALAVWLIAVTLIARNLFNRNRSVYAFTISEVILVIIMIIFVNYLSYDHGKTLTEQNNKYAVLSLQSLRSDIRGFESLDYKDKEFYDSFDYYVLQQLLSEFVTKSGNSSVFKDVLIVHIPDNYAYVSASGRNMEDVGYTYGSEAGNATLSLQNNISNYAWENFYINGNPCVAIGVAGNSFMSDYVLMGVISDAGENERLKFLTTSPRLMLVFVILFIIGTLLLFLIYRVINLDLAELRNGLNDLALGRAINRNRRTYGNDMVHMWNSISEIEKRVEEINYSKYKILEAYFKYAPKNIERVLAKDSILEVKEGEKLDRKGSLVFISTGQTELSSHDGASGLKDVISDIESCQENENSTLISSDSSLSMLEMFFLDEERGVTEFGTNLITDNMKHRGYKRLSAFIYYGGFTYGTVGTEGQLLTYLVGDKMDEMRSYAKFFRDLNLPLVITEYIKRRENITLPLRHIGYIQPGEDTDKIQLYEVLDAVGRDERINRMKSAERFEATLNLFYKKDFYFARNQFSELLKEYPTDELIRWYLFESEKYLNEEVENADFGELHYK
ncbi:MAG: hypothetical protein K6F99_04015 [Lachnospiraceae bacterium]|nr:hypothetical protein [Lachnospiraceae bacterium]